jgi:D-glycero-alpha-D-manno-heptose-7-phosphate kinase
MGTILIQSPTRVDLAGGTLDLWPLYLFVGGASTVNLAISISTFVELQPLQDKSIELISEDLKLRKQYVNLDACLADNDPKMSLLQVQMKYWKPQQGFRLTTKSQSPVGGGLGGSSSLTISLLKAFEQFTRNKFSSVHQRVKVAHDIEAEILNTPTGTQDYYPADCGGINILHYGYDGIQQKVLPLKNSPLDSNFMLVYTGKSHHSGINNFEVMQKAVSKDSKTMGALRELKRVAIEMEKAVVESQWSELPRLFKEEFKFRVQLAPAFSSPEIEKLHGLTLNAGAEAVKICGAGGGGCVMVWVSPEKREQVAKACQKEGFQVLDAKPVAPLTQI